MQVSVTARHFRVTPELRAHAQDRAHRLERWFDRLRKVEVILAEQGGRHFEAEFILSAVRGTVLVCSSMDVTAAAALDAAASRMERQIRGFKQKVRRRHVDVHRRVGVQSAKEHAKLAD